MIYLGQRAWQPVLMADLNEAPYGTSKGTPASQTVFPAVLTAHLRQVDSHL